MQVATISLGIQFLHYNSFTEQGKRLDKNSLIVTVKGVITRSEEYEKRRRPNKSKEMPLASRIHKV
jgi:hypothetical protein